MKKHTYIKAKEEMLILLKTGALIKDNKVLSERVIAEKLNYSRSTIRRAIKSLIEDGVLYRTNHYNSNLYFKEANPFILEVGDNSSNSITQDIKINGMLLEDRIVSFKLVYESVSSEFVGENRFYELIRIRSTNKEVFSFQKAYIPFKLFEDAHRYDFSKISLYSYMEFKGNKPIYFKKKLRFIKPTNELQRFLKLNDNEYLYFFEYYGYNKKNLLVEYTKSYFKQDSIKINFNCKYII